jgi:hypothetical protein
MILAAMASDTGAQTTTGAVSRYVRYSFTVRNTTSALASNVAVYAFAPVLTTAHQVCTSIMASHAFVREADAAGNVMLQFAFAHLPPYATKRITVEATLDLRDTPVPQPLESPAAFLAADRHTDMREPDVGAVPAFAGGTRSQHVARITAWVRTALRQGQYRAAPRGAAAALAAGEGDCTEFMHLVMALCRRAGIPARGASGFVCPRNMTLQPAMLHDWAQWHDGTTWQMADAYEPAQTVAPARYIMVRQAMPAGTASAPLYGCHGLGITLHMNATE